jgi:hypothetical protein
MSDRICPGCRSRDGIHTFDKTCTLEEKPDMEIRLIATRVTVLVGLPGTDEVDIVLAMPSPFPECGYEGHASIKVRKGYGIQWCRENLHVEPEVIQGGGLQTGCR